MRLDATILLAAFCLSLSALQVVEVTAQSTNKQSQEKQTQHKQPQNSTDDDQSSTQEDEPAESATTLSDAQPATQPQTLQSTKTASPSAGDAVAEAEKKNFELTFDDLKFEMEKGDKFDRSLLTEKINSYNNNTITVRGYIRPSFSQSGLKKFIFVRDNKECCFGPGAALYDCILVRLKKGETTDYTVRPITIKGTFTLKEYEGPDGKVWSIYRMNGADVK